MVITCLAKLVARKYFVLLLGWLLFIGGCGTFFDEKSAELQTKGILNELEQVKENPHVDNPLPELYRRAPGRIYVDQGVKILYFTRQHPPDILARLINEQFVRILKDDKGQEISKPMYIISSNEATNQLIFQCPNDEDADKVLEFLDKVDVPPIQVNVDCLILERFADVTMDWETTVKIDNLLGEKITLGGKTDASGNLLPAFPGASLRESKRATFGLDLGYWKNQGITGHEFRAVVDMLISRGYLKILMNPTIEVVNGQKGSIMLRDNVPLEKIIIQPGYDTPFSSTEYQWVADSLEVIPHVFADGSVGLSTKIQLGSKSKPEGVVQTSIITERKIDIAENRIEPGNSLVIGGMRKSEERAVVRGVPFLKDIPVLGVLFSSKDYEEKATEVIFILTPSISSGGIKYSDMIKNVRKQHSTPQYEHGLQQTLTDPFGTTAYAERIERQAAQAQFDQLKAQIEKAQALNELDLIKEQLLDAAEKVKAEKNKVARARAEVIKANNEAQQVKAQMNELKLRSDRATNEAETLKNLLDELNKKLQALTKENPQDKQGKTSPTKENVKPEKTGAKNSTAETDQTKLQGPKLRKT